jgi:hypothetical protein
MHPEYVEGAVGRTAGWTPDFSLYTIIHLSSMVKDKVSFTLVTGSTLPKTELLPKKVISGVSSLPNTIMLLNEVGSLDKNTFFYACSLEMTGSTICITYGIFWASADMIGVLLNLFLI